MYPVHSSRRMPSPLKSNPNFTKGNFSLIQFWSKKSPSASLVARNKLWINFIIYIHEKKSIQMSWVECLLFPLHFPPHLIFIRTLFMYSTIYFAILWQCFPPHLVTSIPTLCISAPKDKTWKREREEKKKIKEQEMKPTTKRKTKGENW